MKDFSKKKNTHKKIRTTFEIVVLIVVIALVIHALFLQKKYVPYGEETKVDNSLDSGFLAVSYFGVDRLGTENLVSMENVDKQLDALKKCGYVTITQQDILDYYKNGKALPEKALFLMFEDGRTDTATFTQSTLKKHNYRGTISVYANRLEDDDFKFLSGKDLKSLEKSTFWEVGSNGYRLAYINVFDRYDRYIGELDSDEFNGIRKYLGRNYNHYLMDYIRDKNEFPLETKSEMIERIDSDYRNMKSTYDDQLGYMPKLYVLMHSNTDYFGNNKTVGQENGKNMINYFQMNFNREGYSVNDQSADLYDLTRMEVQPYWGTNHLLMRAKYDVKEKQAQDIVFEVGDESRASKWTLDEGAAEFDDGTIILTSNPKKTGKISLNDISKLKDFSLNVKVGGTYQGSQNIILGQGGQTDTKISFFEKSLKIYQHNRKVKDINLDELLGVKFDSIEEDKKNALVQIYNSRAESADNASLSMAYRREAKKAEKEVAKSVEEGAKAYIPQLKQKEVADWNVKIVVKNNLLSVYVNDCLAVENLSVPTVSNSISLESGWDAGQYNQNNIYDDVYDAKFIDLYITDASEERILFDNRLQGFDKIKYEIKKKWDALINWFIVNM